MFCTHLLASLVSHFGEELWREKPEMMDFVSNYLRYLSLVEAAGIEPASENTQLEASTGLGQVLIWVLSGPLPRHLKTESE